MSTKDPVREERKYIKSECVVFRKTTETFGGLSNMSAGFPLECAGIKIQSSEILYQACRFPHLPKVQEEILRQRSPMTAKMISKTHRGKTRSDWDRIRVKVMRWCLRLKLAQHWQSFGKLLDSTNERTIVESSSKDSFWGAIPVEDEVLVGSNVLGRLLMELRTIFRSPDRESLRNVDPPDIPRFTLLGHSLCSDDDQQSVFGVTFPDGIGSTLVEQSQSTTSETNPLIEKKRRSPETINSRPRSAENTLLAVLAKVAKSRTVFHSQVDLLSEVYCALRESKSVKRLRAHRPLQWNEGVLNLDLMASIGGSITGIELKYWTACKEFSVGDELYALPARPDREHARYEFWRSIGKIERLVETSQIDEGFIIAITNADHYWRSDDQSDLDQTPFPNGIVIEGRADFPTMHTKKTSNSATSVVLRNRYVINWQDFSSIKDSIQLRMLLIHINAN